MRLFQTILSAFTILFIGCKTDKEEITITGKITGSVPELIEYTVPINGIHFFGFEDSVPTDSLGNFQLKIDIDQACFIELSNGYESYGTVVAEPGMNYIVHIDTENKENAFRIESKNEEGQRLYNQLSNRSMLKGHFEEEAKQYRNDTLVSKIRQSIKTSEEKELQGFVELFKDKAISQDFYDLVRNDRVCFYRGAQGSVGFNYVLGIRGQNALDESQFKELWGEIFRSNPVSDPKLLTSSWSYHYLELYLRYNDLVVKPQDSMALQKIRDQGAIHTYNINNAKKYLSGLPLAYYTAAYIYYEAINKNYEKELVALFEQFKKDYPNSEYTHFIEPEIIPIVEFHKKLEEPLNENIQFVDVVDNTNTLRDVAKELNGKNIYIDVWATWCGPCKKEFKYHAELRELLKSRDMVILYLSIDRDNREKQWHDMVNYYGLEGYHIRANEKLVGDLQRLRGEDSFTIPWHILTNGAGEVIKKYVSGPSEIEKLAKELDMN